MFPDNTITSIGYDDLCCTTTWVSDRVIRSILKEDNQMKKTEEQSVVRVNRDDRNDRIIVELKELETGDVFRIVEDAAKKIYIVVDVNDILEDAEEDFMYCLDVASAKVVMVDKEAKVYVYNPQYAEFRVGSFIKEDDYR